MLPYYVAAALIVAVSGALIAWRSRHAPPDLKISSTRAHGPATREEHRPEALRRPAGVPYTARGTWILSALPDCFRQRWERRGRVSVPAAARLIAPGTTLAFGPCSVHAGADDVDVRRAGDRYGIPPRAHIYAFSGGLLLRTEVRGREELRAYRVPPFFR